MAKKKVAKPAAKKTTAKKKVSKPAAKKKTVKKKVAKPAVKKKRAKKPAVGRTAVMPTIAKPIMTMVFDPHANSGSVDSTVNQTFTGSAQPFVPGMSISVTMTGGSGPRTLAATVNSTGAFSVVVPSTDMTTNTDYLLTAHSSAGHGDAQLSFHTA
jgi:hypothetical protein